MDGRRGVGGRWAEQTQHTHSPKQSCDEQGRWLRSGTKPKTQTAQNIRATLLGLSSGATNPNTNSPKQSCDEQGRWPERKTKRAQPTLMHGRTSKTARAPNWTSANRTGMNRTCMNRSDDGYKTYRKVQRSHGLTSFLAVPADRNPVESYVTS